MLRSQICTIFADAQRASATQRKLVVGLRKIQETCCYEQANPAKQQLHEEFSEAQFNNEVGRCMLRVLTVKKSEAVGDRVVRFLGSFLKYGSERGSLSQPRACVGMASS